MTPHDDATNAPVATIPNESTSDASVASIETSQRPCLVFATNGSAEADAALRFASALAKREELLLRVLTVLEPLPALPAQPAGAAYHMTIEMEQSDRILDRVRDTLSSSNSPSAVTCMLVGSPSATIAEAARAWSAQYIVLGAGRHGAIERLLAGDTVVRVLRHSVVPVIAVPSTRGALPRNGVVAVDFGEASLAAARSAATVIGEGTLRLVHVRPEIDLPATDPGAWSAIYESGADALLAQLTEELGKAHPSLHVETTILRGHVPTVLLDFAARMRAELIAVGQHGHGVVDRFLFGSVANAIVRSAPCAVLVAPPINK
jgi:nucleotide-binding universal stress UspA family protein